MPRAEWDPGDDDPEQAFDNFWQRSSFDPFEVRGGRRQLRVAWKASYRVMSGPHRGVEGALVGVECRDESGVSPVHCERVELLPEGAKQPLRIKLEHLENA
jgi:hypothetical protein